MKVLKETLFERLRNRLAPANAVATIAALEKARRRGSIDYMAVKEASELVDRYRLEAKLAIRVYRHWEARGAVSAAIQPLKDQEGRILLGHARSAASLYLDALRDFRDLARMACDETRAAHDR